MTKICFVDPDGSRHDVEAGDGVSLMEAAVKNGVASIEGECGGACACATCHVYIPAEWQHVTGTIGEDEAMMLEFGVDVDQRSRLGCQVFVTPAMAGMSVFTPSSQR